MRISQQDFERCTSEELAAITQDTYGYWGDSGEENARKELRKRGIPEEEESIWFSRWNGEDAEYEKRKKDKFYRNQFEGYSKEEKIYFVITAPFIVMGFLLHVRFPPLLIDNYKRKYRQRIFYLMIGLAAWALMILLIFQILSLFPESNKDRYPEIDLSDWNYIPINPQ